MSVIEASFVKVGGTLADGTLRLVVDVEPRNAQAAFALFHSPGAPMALAALQAPQEAPEPPKGGDMSKWLALRCQEPDFQRWALHVLPMPEHEVTAARVRFAIKVQSRAEIDNDPAARERFEALIRKPWAEHNRQPA